LNKKASQKQKVFPGYENSILWSESGISENEKVSHEKMHMGDSLLLSDP